MGRYQGIERRDGDLDLAIPRLPFPSPGPGSRAQKRGRCRSHSRIGRIDVQHQQSFMRAASRLDQLHLSIGTVDGARHTCAVCLGFKGNNPRAKPSKGCDAISDMRADINGKIAGSNEAAI